MRMDDVKDKLPGYYDINDRNLRTLGIRDSVGDYNKKLRKELEGKGVKNPSSQQIKDYFNLKITMELYQ